MAITHYKTLFSEYNRGPTSFIHILSKPIAETRDMGIHQEETDKLKEATDQSAEKHMHNPSFLWQPFKR